MHLKNKLIAFIFLFSVGLSAQDYHIGIRAGLNYSKFRGELEQGEGYDLNGGLHFGVYYGYEFTDFFSLRAEFAYTQKGTKQTYSGESYHLFDLAAANRFIIRDSLDYNLIVSNAYLSFPITAHFKTLEKWEFYAGGYVNFSISPIGQGNAIFGTNNPADSLRLEHSFEQGQNHNYRNDRVGEVATGSSAFQVRINGETVNVPSIVGGYFLNQTTQEDLRPESKRFTGIDYGLIAGMSYYLNPGLFLDLRFDYGLRDLTNDIIDRSFREVNDDSSLVFRNDFDRNFGFEVGIGFKF